MLDLVFAVYTLGIEQYLSRPWQLFDTFVTLLHFSGSIIHVTVDESDSLYQLSTLRFIGLARCLHVINWMTMYRLVLTNCDPF